MRLGERTMGQPTRSVELADGKSDDRGGVGVVDDDLTSEAGSDHRNDAGHNLRRRMGWWSAASDEALATSRHGVLPVPFQVVHISMERWRQNGI